MVILKDKIYDVAKWTAMVFLPAVNVFWLAVAAQWGVEPQLVDNVSVTLIAVNGLLGALVGVSNVQYYKDNK